MDEKEVPRKLSEEEETKSLISSLPSEIDCYGVKLFKYQGCWYDIHILQSILNFQRGFEPQETDIVVASFLKAGTSWLKALTFTIVQRSKHLLDDDDDHPLQSHNPNELVPFLEFDLYPKTSTQDFTKFLGSSSSPRLFSTHMSFDALQVPLKESPCKIVYVSRNVKDVLVSLWHFNNSNKEFARGGKIINVLEKCTLEEFFESSCSGVTFFGPFWDQVLSYWRGSLEDPQHVLFMRYEELKAEPHGQIKRLAEFLDCPFTEEEEQSGLVDKILERVEGKWVTQRTI